MNRSIRRILERFNERLTIVRANGAINRFICHAMIFISICMGVTSCEDIFVKDISKKTVDMIAPVNNAILNQTDPTLVWTSTEGAEHYHIIIVSPSFDHIETYACDSITSDYKLKFTLSSGTYQWSVQALNTAYQSLKSYGTFQINKP